MNINEEEETITILGPYHVPKIKKSSPTHWFSKLYNTT